MFPLMGPVQGGEDFMGFVHPGSAMFNRQSGGNYLRWPVGTHPSNPTNRLKCTVSVWFRLGEIANLSIRRALVGGELNSNNATLIQIDAAGNLDFFISQSSTVPTRLITNRVFRDPTAWYHVLLQYDAVNLTPDDRARIWINGVEETSFSTRVNGGTNQAIDFVRSGWFTTVGGVGFSSIPWEGFIADVHLAYDQLVDPSVFGRFHPIHGEWIPRQVSGIDYSDSGFHLDFADPADLGNDVSGQNNDFTAQGTFGAANAFLDVPANTFPIGNSVMPTTGADWSEACLSVTENSGTASGSISTYVLPQGKWYWSTKCGSSSGRIGIYTDLEYEKNYNGNDIIGGSTRRGISIEGTAGNVRVNGALQESVTAFSTNDIVTFWVDNTDPTSVKVWIDINGVQQGTGSPDPATETDPIVTYTNSHPYPERVQCVPGWGHDTSQSFSFDFGQRRGSESFLATALGDFKPISTGNFPVPTGPALQPNKFFDILQYEGDGAASRTLTGLKFQPDLIFLRNLDNAAVSWRCAINMTGYSPSPSTPNNLRCDTGDLPSDLTGGNIEGFNADGFDVADGSVSGNGVNQLNNTFQAWCFKADPAAGFDIVRYQGNGVAGNTFAHNLGEVPELIMVKRLDGTGNWNIYQLAYGDVTDPETDYTWLNSNAARVDNANRWNDTVPTSTQVTLGAATDVNGSGNEYVALLFRSVPGLLKIASMEGNGNVNGGYIPVDFAPRYAWLKNLGAVASQNIFDNVMADTFNQNDSRQAFEQNIVTATNGAHDQLANGWKLRTTLAGLNGNNAHMGGWLYGEVASKFARAR